MQPFFLLLLGLLPILGFWVGGRMAQNRSRQRLTHPERTELSARRAFMDDLAVSAADHIALDDNYARIVADDLRRFRRELK